MTYAIFNDRGKQYKASAGDLLYLEKMESKKKKIDFPEVLLLKTETKTSLGSPYITGAKVKAEIVEQTKGKKIRVATFKAKSRYRKVKGHRHHLTLVKISSIVGREKKAQTKAK